MKLRRAGAAERAAALGRWLDGVLAVGGTRILPFDAEAGRIAGGLADQAVVSGRHPGLADVAVADDLILLTRNGRHFVPLGIAFGDPAEALPGREGGFP